MLVEQYLSMKFYVDREKGIISTGWEELLSFGPLPGTSEPRAQRKDGNIRALDMDVDIIRQSAQRLLQSTDND
eukprot:3284195-Pyramimonas_sp.AAC.1